MLLPPLKHKFALGVTIILAVTATTLLQTEPAIAETCLLEKQSDKSFACTGNDVRVTFADNIRTPSGAALNQCNSGQRFSFIADFHVQTTAKASHDIGLHFATDGDPNGDGAKSGACAADIIKDRHLDPLFPNAVVLGAEVAANLDGNACRDITAAYGWRNIGGKVVTLRVDDALCQDSDGDGKVNLPNCTSWSVKSRAVCSSPQHTTPSSATSCNCDIAFNLPVIVGPGNTQVTTDNLPPISQESKSNVSLLLEARPPQNPDN